jgi:hypothetical protein
MWYPTLNKTRTSPLLLAGLIASGLLFAGCDEHVDVVRDRSVVIPPGATWAWRPAPPPEKAPERAEKDRVVSRDVISDDGRPAPPPRDRERDRIDQETLRLAVRTNIEETLAKKGFHQVDDPAAAEFLVDYHLEVHRGTETVGYPGGYPLSRRHHRVRLHQAEFQQDRFPRRRAAPVESRIVLHRSRTRRGAPPVTRSETRQVTRHV